MELSVPPDTLTVAQTSSGFGFDAASVGLVAGDVPCVGT